MMQKTVNYNFNITSITYIGNPDDLCVFRVFCIDLKINRKRGWEGMEHICVLANLITNSQLLKPFIEPISINVLILMTVVPFVKY